MSRSLERFTPPDVDDAMKAFCKRTDDGTNTRSLAGRFMHEHWVELVRCAGMSFLLCQEIGLLGTGERERDFLCEALAIIVIVARVLSFTSTTSLPSAVLTIALFRFLTQNSRATSLSNTNILQG